MKEMEKRGYQVTASWKNYGYRGKMLDYDFSPEKFLILEKNQNIYPEHNEEYLKECLNNLKSKNINIKID